MSPNLSRERFKKQAREWFRVAMPNMLFDFGKESRTAEIAKPSTTSRVLDKIEDEPGDDREAQDLVLRTILSTCYSGGADTVG
ncbi:hypothetical protein K438DRAFT_827026 [Mycena galopus ATCC 62051]|nr:hypothetical protein K438DRAFT_827026 [Mycena galopus ATCC 62051]